MNNGILIPYLGLGTWDMKGKHLEQAVQWAIDVGYRHFDTATYYNNEKELGKALAKSGLNRSDVFVTTKVWPKDFGYNQTKKAFQASLINLGMDYVDQYLIHWPKDTTRTHETWKALVDLYNEEKCLTIGVSNYSIQQLEELKVLSGIIPATNQIEFSPFHYDPEILKYSRKQGIIVVAYSPLTVGKHLNNPIIVKISEKYDKTPAQLLLRWGLQHNAVVIPKSANKNRINENASIFDFTIDSADMESLNNINNR
jgi:diketogulonate reductase-like aldo/keto reductase